MAAFGTARPIQERAAPRDEVHFRARADDSDGRSVNLLIVNISTTGLMARCDIACAVGARLTVKLPVVGNVMAEIRWLLGGRIGCEFGSRIELFDDHELLGALRER